MKPFETSLELSEFVNGRSEVWGDFSYRFWPNVEGTVVLTDVDFDGFQHFFCVKAEEWWEAMVYLQKRLQ